MRCIRMEDLDLQKAGNTTILPESIVEVGEKNNSSGNGHIVFANSDKDLFAKREAEASIKVLCFGDSLTRGHNAKHIASPNHIATPYANTLNALAYSRNKLKNIYFKPVGLTGATAEMIKGLSDEITKGDYKLVIILGGTHDIATRKLPSFTIYENLKKLHEACWERSIKTIGVAIPQSGLEAKLGGKRKEANRLLREFLRHSKDKGLYFNLDELIPYQDKGEFWESRYDPDDIVHLSQMGYQKFGQLLYEVLEKLDVLLTP